MPRPRAHLAALVILTALASAGCAPTSREPTPTPTPTALTEAQAYAAAEEAFREYIAAINEIDVADPSTFEPAFGLSTGQLNAFDREQYSTWHAEGWTKSGSAVVTSLEPSSIPETGTVQLAVCLDVSEVELTDSTGASQVATDRPPHQSLYATVEQAGDSWSVANLYGRGDGAAC